ncbi:MAG: glutamate formimidoyltransferase [Euryarchaeota archaeon]|nr:glutamate formimidoyltransferase [Euryarchaeota archaeon]OUW22535.1 MAG: glutamate formimidoyltransferase [Euryarchaeota archaeon TMED173]
MEMRLVECVPNFSEGKDPEIIRQITRPIRESGSVTLLDIDMGSDFNRTVVTMVGDPEQVLSVVIECTIIASELIDMRKHTGEHARMGAIDVVPFIPINGVTIDDCVKLSERYGEAISKELDLPVFLYADAARIPERIRLPDIRRGEYEGLEQKLATSAWAPDFGPQEFNPKLGATATGARSILIAFNVNLDTDDKSKANAIAGRIRTSGTLIKNENGEKILGDDGKPLRNPGLFQSLQAAGWMFNESTAQVSMNLLDFKETGLHDVTEAIRKQAKEIGLNVTAGELVGLVPLEAMLLSGKFYSRIEGQKDEKSLVDSATEGLMLDRLEDFDPNSCIIEWAISKKVVN